MKDYNQELRIAQAQLDAVTSISDRAHAEIAWTRKYYGWLLLGITLVSSVGISAFYFLYTRNVSEMRADMRLDIESINKRLTQDAEGNAQNLKNGFDLKATDLTRQINDLTQKLTKDAQSNTENLQKEYNSKVLDFETKITEMTQNLTRSAENNAQSLQKDLNSKVESFESQVSDRITKQFEADNINQIISDTAKTKIDKITEEFVTNKANEIITPKINNVLDQIQTAQGEISKMNEETDFATILILASRDNRSAFDQLIKAANSPSNPHSEIAMQVAFSIASDPFLTGILGPNANFDRIKVDILKDSLVDIAPRVMLALPSDQPTMLSAIWDSPRF